MTELDRDVLPVATRSSMPAGSRSGYDADVLLIADEPRHPASRRNGRAMQRGSAARANASIEPLDMESVVRKLIALFSEEPQP